MLRPKLFARMSVCIYLGFSTVGLLASWPVLGLLNFATGAPLVASILIYILGIVFHLWERLLFQRAIWHGFVVVAACVHYFAVLDGVRILSAPILLAGSPSLRVVRERRSRQVASTRRSEEH
jgi:channel protein (hemolysin III family)